MKKVITVVSVLLIAAGLKAQKANVQKETVKPRTDSIPGSIAGKRLNKPASQQKEAKIAPAFKFAPAVKQASIKQ